MILQKANFFWAGIWEVFWEGRINLTFRIFAGNAGAPGMMRVVFSFNKKCSIINRYYYFDVLLWSSQIGAIGLNDSKHKNQNHIENLVFFIEQSTSV